MRITSSVEAATLPKDGGDPSIALLLFVEMRFLVVQQNMLTPRGTINDSSRAASRKLSLACGRSGGIEDSGWIKEALVPQSGVGQLPGLPLLQGRKSSSHHAAVGGVEDDDDSRQLV